MFLMVQKRNDNNPFSSEGSFIRRTMNGTNAKASSEVDRRYDKIDKKLGSLHTEVSSEIKKTKKVIAEIREQYPNNTKVIFDGHAVVSSLYSTKLATIKAMMSATKERTDLNMKETKLVFDMTGKNTSSMGGTLDQKLAISGTIGSLQSSNGMTAGNAAYALTSYGGEILAEDQFTKNNVAVPPQQQQHTVVQPQQSSSQPVTVAPTQEAVPQPTVNDDKFTDLLADVNDTENSRYLNGDNNASDNFRRINKNMSYGTAMAALQNKESSAVKMVHYDPNVKISWVRTHDSNGNLVPVESLSSMHVLGNITIEKRSGKYEALDELGNSYDVVIDTHENMPDILKEEYEELES